MKKMWDEKGRGGKFSRNVATESWKKLGKEGQQKWKDEAAAMNASRIKQVDFGHLS